MITEKKIANKNKRDNSLEGSSDSDSDVESYFVVVLDFNKLPGIIDLIFRALNKFAALIFAPQLEALRILCSLPQPCFLNINFNAYSSIFTKQVPIHIHSKMSIRYRLPKSSKINKFLFSKFAGAG